MISASLGAAIKSVIFLVAFGFAAFAFALLRRRVAVFVVGAEAEGIVVSHDRREMDESVGFHPVVQFTDEHGRLHVLVSSAGWSRPSPAVGQRVKVRYLLSNPEVAFISSVLHMWAMPMAMIICAAAFLIGALRA